MGPLVKPPQVRLPTEEEYWTFASRVPMPTKDFGLVPIQAWGTQRVLIRAIFEGLRRGIRQFVILKARQVGASTALLLLALLWMWRFKGLQGLSATDSDENREFFRDTLSQMCLAMLAAQDPDASPLRVDNNKMQAWENGSRLVYQVAGPRAGKRLGIGKGVAFCWGTEASRWAKGEFLGNLRAAFSEVNPIALYAFESTAYGKNWWFDLWNDAQDAATMMPIFLAWWQREDNRVGRHDPRWRKYWNGLLTKVEREWDTQLRARYHVTLKPEQWAWRRWYVAEKASHSQRLANQDMPTLPEDAFAASQNRPFLGIGPEGQTLAERIRQVIASGPVAKPYTYQWGMQLEDTRPLPTDEEHAPHLRVWEPPDHRPTMVAAVPAYSSFPEDPSWVVSVWAASLTEDRLEQVAEFHSEAAIGLQPFAWVIMHLVACYSAVPKGLILEVAGLGQGVLQEIRRMVATGWGTLRRHEFRAVFGGVQHYLWRRPDSIGALGALHWKSGPETQGAVLQRLADQLRRGTLVVRSSELLEELDRLEGVGDTYEPSGRDPRGGRAMAAALAVEGWSAQIHPQLKRLRPAYSATTVGQRTVQTFLAGLGRR